MICNDYLTSYLLKLSILLTFFNLLYISYFLDLHLPFLQNLKVLLYHGMWAIQMNVFNFTSLKLKHKSILTAVVHRALRSQSCFAGICSLTYHLWKMLVFVCILKVGKKMIYNLMFLTVTMSSQGQFWTLMI